MKSDPSKCKKLREIGRKQILFAAAWQPGSTRIFAGGSDFLIHDIDVAEKKPEPRTFSGHESYVSSCVWLDNVVVSGSFDGRLIWWDVERGEAIRSVNAHEKWVRQIARSPDGEFIATVSDDMVCRLWRAKDGAQVRELRGHEKITPNHFPSMLYAVAFSHDGKHLATADRTGKTVVWETKTGKNAAVIQTPEMYTWDARARIHAIGGVRSLAFHPKTNHLAIGGMGKVGNIDHLGGVARVEVFDWQANNRKLEFADGSYKGLVECLKYSDDGKWLLAAGGDNSGFMQFIDTETGKAIKQEKAPMHIHDVVLQDEQKQLVAVGHNKIALYSL